MYEEIVEALSDAIKSYMEYHQESEQDFAESKIPL